MIFYKNDTPTLYTLRKLILFFVISFRKRSAISRECSLNSHYCNHIHHAIRIVSLMIMNEQQYKSLYARVEYTIRALIYSRWNILYLNRAMRTLSRNLL